jgi:DNA polymerase-3 subunit beta
VAQAQSVVERRNTIPILANVLIEAEGVASQFPRHRSGHRGRGPGPGHGRTRRIATTVSAVMLHEIVRKLPDGALVT